MNDERQIAEFGPLFGDLGMLHNNDPCQYDGFVSASFVLPTERGQRMLLLEKTTYAAAAAEAAAYEEAACWKLLPLHTRPYARSFPAVA